MYSLALIIFVVSEKKAFVHTKGSYGSFEEMKKGTSAIHGTTFFFIKRGMAQRHSIFLYIKH
jgi:hypothetical protein